MSKYVLLLIMVTPALTSFGQRSKSMIVELFKELEKSMTVWDVNSQTVPDVPREKRVDTRFVYVDSIGQKLIIENSYPRGGLKYTDPLGEEYVYAVFWTQIINETNNPVEFKMKFFEDSYNLLSSPGRIFKLSIPSDTLTLEKEQLFNYGLDVDFFLDNNFRKHTDLVRTINSKDSSGFYVITLFNQGVNGTLRAGLKINNGKLAYQVNDRSIDCGEINLKLLKLKE